MSQLVILRGFNPFGAEEYYSNDLREFKYGEIPGFASVPTSSYAQLAEDIIAILPQDSREGAIRQVLNPANKLGEPNLTDAQYRALVLNQVPIWLSPKEFDDVKAMVAVYVSPEAVTQTVTQSDPQGYQEPAREPPSVPSAPSTASSYSVPAPNVEAEEAEEAEVSKHGVLPFVAAAAAAYFFLKG